MWIVEGSFGPEKGGRPSSLPPVMVERDQSRANYLPDLAGAEAGAGLAFSSTECEPVERT